MSDDLVKRLRLWGEHGLTNTLSDLVEAADRIEALTAENERLERSVDSWTDDARTYANNADYWKAEVERLRAALELITREGGLAEHRIARAALTGDGK